MSRSSRPFDPALMSPQYVSLSGSRAPLHIPLIGKSNVTKTLFTKYFEEDRKTLHASGGMWLSLCGRNDQKSASKWRRRAVRSSRSWDQIQRSGWCQRTAEAVNNSDQSQQQHKLLRWPKSWINISRAGRHISILQHNMYLMIDVTQQSNEHTSKDQERSKLHTKQLSMALAAVQLGK